MIHHALKKALKDFDFSEITRLRVLMENPFEDRPDVFKKYVIDENFYPQETPPEFLGRQTSCSA